LRQAFDCCPGRARGNAGHYAVAALTSR
jgi:hypothetical protein